MLELERIVGDTNVLVGRLLLPKSVPADAVRKAVREGQLLVSEDTVNELAEALSRRKLDRYVSLEDRKQFLRQLGRASRNLRRPSRVSAECRDQRDDKLLEVALNGRAELILTGDADLLLMNPWRKVEVLSPAGFLEKH